MKRLPQTLLYIFTLSVIVTVASFLHWIYHYSTVTPLLNFSPPCIFDFKQAEDAYPYAEALEKGTLDTDALNDATFHLGRKPPSKYLEHTTAPITISYYSDPTDKTPVYTINKGETIYYRLEFYEYNSSYYGIQSLPTDRRGWRLARPFIISGERPNDTLLYVKTRDLLAVSREWYKENPILDPGNSYTKPEKLWYKINQPWLNTLFVDRVFYTRGIYLSPDLVAYVSPPTPLIFLSASAVLLAVYLFAKFKPKIKHKNA